MPGAYGVGYNFAPQASYAVRAVTQVFSSATVADITGCALPVIAGHRYEVSLVITARTTLAGTGIKLAVTTPTLTRFSLAVLGRATAADGTGSLWNGILNASADVVVSTGGNTADLDQTITAYGHLTPSASGTLAFQSGSETGTENVSIEMFTLTLTDFGPA